MVCSCCNIFYAGQSDSLNRVKIRIYSAKKMQSFFIKSNAPITIYIDSTKVPITVSNSVLCEYLNPDSFRVLEGNQVIKLKYCEFKSDSLLVTGLTDLPKKLRRYEGFISCTAKKDSLMLLNILPMERYIAGVTEAEGGKRCHSEFYKVQSVLARTYLLSHWFKHALQNFQLCDQEHCQVYYGKPQNKNVGLATESTQGQVLVDENERLIVSAFHSNSGGQTANSEDVWGGKTSYLKSVTDSFSMGMPSYRWQKKISKQDWLRYLKEQHRLTVLDHEVFESCNWDMQQRKTHITIKGVSISTRQLRKDFKLRSTFFSSNLNSKNELVFNGRGFGHGVGLSQEGAMKMAQNGFNYKTIVHHYFQNVKMLPFKTLVNKNEN